MLMKTPKRTLRVYKSYNFTDKDPIIDYARTAIAKSGRSMNAIANASEVSRTTLDGWFRRRVRRPQFATVAAVLLEVGVRSIPLGIIAKRRR